MDTHAFMAESKASERLGEIILLREELAEVEKRLEAIARAANRATAQFERLGGFQSHGALRGVMDELKAALADTGQGHNGR